jgi:hypothetical protein
MIVELFANPITGWLFGTAVLFTLVGWRMSLQNKKIVIASTIDSLIRDGYLKTRGSGENMEILRWYDNDEQAN